MEASIRFWSKVDGSYGNCWEWKGGVAGKGYGSFYLNGRRIKAHRYAYQTLVGAIPEGLEIDHLCRNRKCVNPNHMEVVTRGENIRRGLWPDIGRQYQQKKTHCPQGHPYDEENTYLRPDRSGRECRACRSETIKRWWLENGRS